jgi:hypothetical protein
MASANLVEYPLLVGLKFVFVRLGSYLHDGVESSHWMTLFYKIQEEEEQNVT